MPESTKSAWDLITSSVTSFLKELFSRPEPYKLVDITKNPDEYNVSMQSVLSELNNRLKSNNKNGNVPLFTMKELDSAFKYLSLQTELKPGDVIKAKDGKISYEDFQKVAQDMENVSKKDYSFGGRMPTIMIMSKFPPEGSREKEILDIRLRVRKGNMFYSAIDDTVTIINGSNNFTVAEHKGLFSHEYGHRLSAANNGFIMAMYDINKHAHALFGDKFAEGCEGYVVDGKLQDSPELRKYIYDLEPNGKCADTIKQIDIDKTYAVDPKIMYKNIELSHTKEYSADQYATLANKKYGDALISYFKNNYAPTGNTHPSTLQRAEEMAQVMANPAYYKAQLEKNIAEFNQFSSAPTNSDNAAEKTPASTPPQASIKSTTRTAPN